MPSCCCNVALAARASVQHKFALAYSSAAFIPDILFLELAQERGWETYVVLPVPYEIHLAACRTHFKDVFSSQSSLFWSQNDSQRRSVEKLVNVWMKRLAGVLRLATKVDVSNDLSPEASSTNLQYCSLILNGVAVMKATQLGAEMQRVYVRPFVNTDPLELRSRDGSRCSSRLSLTDARDDGRVDRSGLASVPSQHEVPEGRRVFAIPGGTVPRAVSRTHQTGMLFESDDDDDDNDLNSADFAEDESEEFASPQEDGSLEVNFDNASNDDRVARLLGMEGASGAPPSHVRSTSFHLPTSPLPALNPTLVHASMEALQHAAVFGHGDGERSHTSLRNKRAGALGC